MNWYISVLKKYAVFSGRAQRKEYWMFTLFSLIISIVLSLLDGILGFSSEGGYGLLNSLYMLAILLPSFGVAIRRLHDTNRSGWWLLIVLIPLIGAIVLLVFFVQDSQPGENRFGSNPKGVSAAPPAAPAAPVVS